MRVLIAAVSAASELSGVQRHAFNLASCLLTLPEISRIDLVIASWQVKMASRHGPCETERLRIHVETMRNTSVSRNIWFYDGLPWVARSLGVDLVHASYPVPLRRKAIPCPVVVTLHDLYPYDTPRNFGFTKAGLNRRILQQCLHSVDRIACVSDATVAALKMHTTPGIWGKASRIYNCVEAPAGEPQYPENLVIARAPFLLCVAQHRYNKNIALALLSFHRLLQRRTIDSTMRLVVVGIRGPETPRLQRLIEQLGLRGLVVMTEGLSDAALLWCYKQCAALLMPSLTEGFGLPAVEAMLSGCKVVCSDIPALREIGDEYCQFVALTRDPVESFAEAIAVALRRPCPPPVSAPQFAVSHIAKQYSALYRDLVTNIGTAAATTMIADMNNSPASERSI